MHVRTLALLLAAGALGSSASAQATSVTEPANDYLLRITQSWGADSRLGALKQRAMGPDDVELRVWSGYGLGGTSGFVMRRTAGHWQAWYARQVYCRLEVPIPVGDTASDATERRLIARARRKCNTSLGDTRHGATIIRADTVALETLRITDLDSLWTRALAAGARTLPPRIEREWIMSDGFTHVIELREGDVYRASVIEHVKPEVEAGRQVQAVYKVILDALGAARDSAAGGKRRSRTGTR